MNGCRWLFDIAEFPFCTGANESVGFPDRLVVRTACWKDHEHGYMAQVHQDVLDQGSGRRDSARSHLRFLAR
jgi:hypothetical protein